MNILVVGDGQMGRSVEQLAPGRGHTVLGPVGRADASDARPWQEADVAIDFSIGSSVANHVELALQHEVAIVVGTTGWQADLERISERVAEARGTLVWGANFSIGFHILQQLARTAGRIAGPFPDFDAGVFEHHHRLKRDAPSGSALALARTLIEELPEKTRIETGAPDGAIKSEALHVASLRAGAEPGLHRVFFDGPFESIVLEHRVRDRAVFAAGAIYAAEHAVARTGVIRFADLVEDSMNKGRELWS